MTEKSRVKSQTLDSIAAESGNNQSVGSKMDL